MILLSRSVAFRVTKKEYAVLRETAKKNGLPLSQWIREICTQAAKDGARVAKSVEYEESADR